MNIRSNQERSVQGAIRTIFAILMSMAILFGPFGSLVPNVRAESTRAIQAADVDAAFFHRGEKVSYFFKGDQYYRLTGTNVDAGYPKDLPGEWKGLPASFHSGIDAAVQDPSSNNIYFFKGNAYSAFNSVSKTAYPGYDNVMLPGGWQGLPASFYSGIDAALDDNGSVILYKGRRHVVLKNERFVSETDIPASVLATGPINAAFQYSNGRNYFFSGSKVARAIGSAVEPGWPNETKAVWIGVGTAAAGTTATTSGSTTSSPPAAAERPSPLTINEMEHVMQWISVKTSAARLPFCWRQSKGRGAGQPMICEPGYDQETLGLCYKPCGNDEKGIATSCYKNCPAGFRDDGLYCGKPGAYSRGAGYVIWDRAKCEKENPQGCEQGGAIWYPKCKAGFHGAVTQCSPTCPAGWEDIGVSCKKPATARDVKPLTMCPAGLVKDGALCYPACEPGTVAGVQETYVNAGPPNKYKGVGPVCWQNCPSQQNVDCGAGCATTKGQCAKSVLTMTTAPIIAALKIGALIATFGGSSGATAGAGVTAAGAKIGIAGPKLAKLAAMADKLQKLYKANEKAIKASIATQKVLGAIKSETNLFAAEFAKNFGDMTSPAIEKEIDSRFSKEAALEIKKAWAVRHLALMLEANSFVTAKNVIDVAGAGDPTGIVGVVSAFINPMCKDDMPFPTVRAKY